MVDEGASMRVEVVTTPIEGSDLALVPSAADGLAALGIPDFFGNLHQLIPNVDAEGLRRIFEGAGQLGIRAWEVQGHAITEALDRGFYGEGARMKIAHAWKISSARVYQLRNAWELRSRYEGRKEIVERLPEASWWITAATAKTVDADADTWIARAAERHGRSTAYSSHQFARDVRASQQLLRIRDDAAARGVELAGETREYLEAHAGDLVRSVIVGERFRPGYGKTAYPGGSNPLRILDLWRHYGTPGRVLDPMAGSDSTGDLCRSLGVPYEGYDVRPADESATLHGSFDSLSTPIPGAFDFVWWHPPYADLIDYRHGPGDLSTEHDYPTFLERYRAGFRKFWEENVKPGGLFAVLIGDVRRGGRYRPLCAETIGCAPDDVDAVIVLTHDAHQGDIQAQAHGSRPAAIPIVHEELIVFRRPRSAPSALNADLPPHAPGERGVAPRVPWIGNPARHH